jgi:hypothetical protein
VVVYVKVSIGKIKKNGERTTKVSISKHDTYNLDTTLARVIVPALKAYKKRCRGYPGCFDNMRDWHTAIDLMIEAFEFILEENDTHRFQGSIDAGLQMFAKHYQRLWM